MKKKYLINGYEVTIEKYRDGCYTVDVNEPDGHLFEYVSFGTLEEAMVEALSFAAVED